MTGNEWIKHSQEIKEFVLNNPVLYNYYGLGNVEEPDCLWRILRVETLQIIKAVNKHENLRMGRIMINKDFLYKLLALKWYNIPYQNLRGIEYI